MVLVASMKLQQRLPFTVLKRNQPRISRIGVDRCNSAYRLRY